MKTRRKRILALLGAAFISFGIAGSGRADEPRSDVISQADIQYQIDRQVDARIADRKAVQELLSRPDVRQIAGAAGLDVERASAAAGLLSGPELRQIATRIHEGDGTVGGTQTVTLSVTAIVIILLLIIILAN